MNDKNLEKNKEVYLIFGATGGIGSELSRTLSEKGARLVLCSNNEEKLKLLSDETGADSYFADATDFKGVQDCVNFTLDKYGRLDGTANCVGSIFLKSAHLTKEEDWNRTISLNLTSAFATLGSSARAMVKQRSGSIVLVSSAAALAGLPNHDAIAAAKAGVVGLTQSAAATYARYGIRVNCVAPGLVRTPLTEGLTSNEAVLEKSTKMHPLGRIGEPGDIASAISWLLDPAQSWVTGQVLGVDGGLAKLRSLA